MLSDMVTFQETASFNIAFARWRAKNLSASSLAFYQLPEKYKLDVIEAAQILENLGR